MFSEFKERLRYLGRRLVGDDISPKITLRCPKLYLGEGQGRWCVNPVGLESAIVFSIGVGTNISFDLELIERFNCIVWAFDPTPISKQWIAKQNVPENFHFVPFGSASYDGTQAFAKPPKNRVTFVPGYESPERIDLPVKNLRSLMDFVGAKPLLLKIDIEGGEYAVIDQLIECCASQLLIEFHHWMKGCSIDQTQKALEKLSNAGWRLFNVSSSGQEYSFMRA
jgi:FkbM family methyltransferase